MIVALEDLAERALSNDFFDLKAVSYVFLNHAYVLTFFVIEAIVILSG